MAEKGVEVTGLLSRVVEWKIDNITSLLSKTELLVSPTFSLGGSTFCLRVHKCGGYETVQGCTIDLEPAPKKVTYLGTKKTDATGIRSIEYALMQIQPSRGTHVRTTYIDWPVMEERKEGDALTLTCRIKCEALTSETPQQDPQQLVELESLSSDFKNMLSSEMKWDITVLVQGKEFRAHRAVLSARSSVFRAMYEHDTSEDQTGMLPITDCDPNTFGQFLNFLYTGKLDEVSFCAAYNLYATAEKYDVQQLKTFCADYLTDNLSPENVCDVVILADTFDDDGLRSAAQEFFNRNSLKIFQKSEWTTLLKNNYLLADKLLKGMASGSTKNN